MLVNGPENRDASKGATELDSLAPRQILMRHDERHPDRSYVYRESDDR